MKQNVTEANTKQELLKAVDNLHGNIGELMRQRDEARHWVNQARHMLTSMQMTGALTDGQQWLLDQMTANVPPVY